MLEWLIKKRIKREIEDNEYLFRSITNSTIQKRLKESLQWYVRKAVENKYIFYTLSLVTIIFPFAADVLLLFSTVTDIFQKLAAIAMACSGVAASVLGLFDARKKWRMYRNQAELIKRELSIYGSNENGRTEESEERVMKRVEDSMMHCHEDWKKSMEPNK